MKTVLASAEVDTDQFKAHSTRSAAAKSAGVLLKDIMTMADWSRETTFTHFWLGSLVEQFSVHMLPRGENIIHCFERYAIMYAGLPRHGIEGLARISMI